jgi:hypothetical protein
MTFDIGLFLAQLPLRVSVPLVLFLAVSASFLGSWIFNSIFTTDQLTQNNSVGGVKFQFIGEVFAVTLGLALIGAFDHYAHARDAAQKEVSTLQALSRASDAYDQPEQANTRIQMKSTVRNYSRAVVEQEWHSMSFGIKNFQVSQRFREMTDAFTLAHPVNAMQEVLQQNTVEWTREVGELRNFRLTTVSRSLIALIWIIILFGVAIAICFPWFFGMNGFLSQAAMSALLSAFIALHLIVIVNLAYPFLGDTAISPEGFLELSQ